MPEASVTLEIVLRWVHFVAGTTWIGLLYFFNLVNVPVMKVLDGPTKGKVIPVLMPKALWYFRHAAWVTVLVGFIYYYLIVAGEPDHGKVMGMFLVLAVLAWAAIAGLLHMEWKPGKGIVLGIVVAAVAAVYAFLVVKLTGGEGHSSRALSIGVGGGYGVIMLLNVWGIIWRCQKKLIAWTADNAAKGTPVPPESAALARRAFLASRTNTWLSLPMLFFMGTASHFPGLLR